MTTAVHGRICPHCGIIAPPGMRAHHECALDATRKAVNERIERDLAREKRDERSKLDTAAYVGARQERERIVALLRESAREYRRESSQAVEASVLSRAANKAAALEEMAQVIEETKP